MPVAPWLSASSVAGQQPQERRAGKVDRIGRGSVTDVVVEGSARLRRVGSKRQQRLGIPVELRQMPHAQPASGAPVLFIDRKEPT